ncbi:hypothetical protein AA0242T_1947 [Acetobacter aceti NRIC 0242]|uniref:Uncharacterized protein n=1 Tax=Acetobacter aceti NBRC 14818 TaxID=887700 RepID=A0AB33IG43_ACEAC|nr:hypothetical protein EMQ_1574 [Acetobacter aceti NBRC 14818]GAN58866.1 hypothetical protein Abac_086_032 [Acetobacter aceti NBRC 14818]GBO81245.1 hypothetical protein AA0242T_1947 [Acetobacter aceti NRIC 0242]
MAIKHSGDSFAVTHENASFSLALSAGQGFSRPVMRPPPRPCPAQHCACDSAQCGEGRSFSQTVRHTGRETQDLAGQAEEAPERSGEAEPETTGSTLTEMRCIVEKIMERGDFPQRNRAAHKNDEHDSGTQERKCGWGGLIPGNMRLSLQDLSLVLFCRI